MKHLRERSSSVWALVEKVAQKALDHARVLGAATDGAWARLERVARDDAGTPFSISTRHGTRLLAAEYCLQSCGQRLGQRKSRHHTRSVACCYGGDQHRSVAGVSRDEEATQCVIESMRKDERRDVW